MREEEASALFEMLSWWMTACAVGMAMRSFWWGVAVFFGIPVASVVMRERRR